MAARAVTLALGRLVQLRREGGNDSMSERGAVTLLATRLLSTVQDAGRPGWAVLGIGRSGACDRRSYELANRLVGNVPGADVDRRAQLRPGQNLLFWAAG